MAEYSLVTLFLLALVAFAAFQWSRQKLLQAVPPGPKPVPIVGNVLDLTASELWLTATKWAKAYGTHLECLSLIVRNADLCEGDVVYVHLVGQGLVFLSSSEAAFELLEKRGSIYSDKPSLVMAGELCGCEKMVAFTPYGERSKAQRRLILQALGPQAIPNYYPLIQKATHQFLGDLLKDPTQYADCTRVYAGSLTLSTVYGYQVSGRDDVFLKLAEECVSILSNGVASGGGIWPVDIFPSMKNMPEWMPGSAFLAKARRWNAKFVEFTDAPYEFLTQSMVSTS